MSLPGTIWLSLIVAITAWVQQSFPDEWWISGIVIVLGALAKLIEIYWVKPKPEESSRMMGEERSKSSRFWVG